MLFEESTVLLFVKNTEEDKMKVLIRALKRLWLGTTCLVLLLSLPFLSSCCQKIDNPVCLTPQATADAHIDTGTVPSATGRPTDEKATWGKCTVRVINYLFGTEFYVLKSDGSYNIYRTPDICSLSAFNEGRCPVETIMSSTLSDEELSKLKTILSTVYMEGRLLPIEEKEGGYACEGIYFYISVDDSEEVSFVKDYFDWNDYPPKEYDELIQFAHSLSPQASVTDDLLVKS